MKQQRLAATGYGILFFLELLANIWMASGFSFFGESAVLSAARAEMLKYFTIDSNILMGLVACLLMIFNIQMLRGERNEIPKAFYYVNLAATAGVALTMLVTVFFLAPSFGSKWLGLFQDSNFLLHLINPLIAIFLFVSREKRRFKCFPTTLAGLVPMLLYGTFYCTNAILQAVDGIVPKSADWYGFLLSGNVTGVPLVILAVSVATWLISLALWALQQGRVKRSEH